MKVLNLLFLFYFIPISAHSTNDTISIVVNRHFKSVRIELVKDSVNVKSFTRISEIGNRRIKKRNFKIQEFDLLKEKLFRIVNNNKGLEDQLCLDGRWISLYFYYENKKIRKHYMCVEISDKLYKEIDILTKPFYRKLFKFINRE